MKHFLKIYCEHYNGGKTKKSAYDEWKKQYERAPETLKAGDSITWGNGFYWFKIKYMDEYDPVVELNGKPIRVQHHKKTFYIHPDSVEKNCDTCKHKCHETVKFKYCRDCFGDLEHTWEPKEEKTCETCKYDNCAPWRSPCNRCKKENDKYEWEPKEKESDKACYECGKEIKKEDKYHMHYFCDDCASEMHLKKMKVGSYEAEEDKCSCHLKYGIGYSCSSDCTDCILRTSCKEEYDKHFEKKKDRESEIKELINETERCLNDFRKEKKKPTSNLMICWIQQIIKYINYKENWEIKE